MTTPRSPVTSPRPWQLAALALLASIVLFAFRGPAPSGERLGVRNLIVIVIDALRADHLGCYGYRRGTSPFIDSLAAHGVRFVEARANSSFTRESVAVLMSGRLPSRSGSVGWGARPAADAETIGQLFARAGYTTGFFSATTMLTDPLFTRGFQTVEQLTERWGASGLGPTLSARAVEFARSAVGRPMMMYVHYLDPHGPYDPPDDLYRKFARAPVAAPLGLYSDVRPRLPELVAEGFGPGDARFEDMVDRYDAEIADTDRAIRQLFAGLDALGILDDTLVILTADHGEEFLEHGFVEHAWTLYEEVLRVPLVVWSRSALPAMRVAEPAALVDILPSVLRLMPVAAAPARLDGRPLLEIANGHIRPTAGSRPYIGELLIAERNVVRAVIDGDRKYVAAQKWLGPAERPAAARVENERRKAGGDPVDLRGPVVDEELYDLRRDPREDRNVVAALPPEQRALRGMLRSYLESTRRASPGGDVRRPETISPDDRARLRALGYAE